MLETHGNVDESRRRISGTAMRDGSPPCCQLFWHHGKMDEEQVVRSLAALAQPVRLKVFRALVVIGQTGLTPGAMAEGLGIPANTLSFHLKELAHAGLVTHERAGRNLIYRAAYAHMNALLRYLTENCCEGTACAAASTAPCGSDGAPGGPVNASSSTCSPEAPLT